MEHIQEAFHGKLVEKPSGGNFRLTPLGDQLASLFETAATNGFDWNTTIHAVGSLDVFEWPRCLSPAKDCDDSRTDLRQLNHVGEVKPGDQRGLSQSRSRVPRG